MVLARVAWNAYLAWHLRGQARLPFRPPAEIERRQARAVRRMVAHAYHTVPHYRRVMDGLRLRPADFRDAADLARLPLLEKTELQRDPESFVSTAHRLDRCLKLRTGGSTGVPCTIYHATAALFQNAAHGERERAMTVPLIGRSFGYRETVIGSPTTTDRVVQDYCQARGLFPSALRIKRQYLSLVDSPETNLAKINEFQPDVIRSYGSYLELLFPYIHASSRAFHRPKLITYSSDGVSSAVRRLILETFGLPLFSLYESVEAFKIGFECERRTGVHLNVDLYPVRIVDADGAPVPDGESGDVVVSNLVNGATVLLNYRLGDLATKRPAPCACGRSLPLLSLPEGRADEYLHLAGGRVMHPQSVRTIVLEEEDVWQFQVVQESTTALRVDLVTADTADRPRITERLTARLGGVFGPEVTARIVFVNRIDRPTAGGKFRVVVSLAQKAAGTRDGARGAWPATGGPSHAPGVSG